MPFTHGYSFAPGHDPYGRAHNWNGDDPEYPGSAVFRRRLKVTALESEEIMRSRIINQAVDMGDIAIAEAMIRHEDFSLED